MTKFISYTVGAVLGIGILFSLPEYGGYILLGLLVLSFVPRAAGGLAFMRVQKLCAEAELDSMSGLRTEPAAKLARARVLAEKAWIGRSKALLLVELITAQIAIAEARLVAGESAARRALQVAADGASRAIALCALGKALSLQDKHDEAETALRQACALAAGHGNLMEADLLYTLGGALVDRRKLREGESVLEQALALARKETSDDARRVQSVVLAALGLIAQTRQDHGEALSLYEQAHELVVQTETQANSTHISAVLVSMSAVLSDLGRYQDAEDTSRRILQLTEGCPPPHDRHYAMALNNLADALFHQGRIDEAEPPARNCIPKLEEQKMGGSAWDTLAKVQVARGELDQAASSFEQAIRLKLEHRSNSDDLDKTLEAYADLMHRMGLADKAASLRKQAFEVREEDKLAWL